MKVKRNLKNLVTLVAVGAVMAISGIAHAAPTTYNITQSFGADGTVTASFAGEETIFDGVLESSEISSFSMSFTGPAYTGSFSSVDWTRVSWVIGDTHLEDGGTEITVEGTDLTGKGFAWNAGGFYYIPGDSVLGKVILLDPVQAPTILTTGDAPTVSSVPEPETYAMMLAGLGALAAVGRRQKRRAS